jgi:hypothetical protein
LHSALTLDSETAMMLLSKECQERGDGVVQPVRYLAVNCRTITQKIRNAAHRRTLPTGAPLDKL